MNNELSAFFAGIISGALLIGVCVIIFGLKSEGRWQRDIVKAGHAHFYLDENNDKQWEWNDPCSPKPMELSCGTVLHK